MMKFIFFVFFMVFMILSGNFLVMFYYNLCFMLSFMMINMFLSKWEMNYWGLSMIWGCDSYSYYLIMLSMWILGLMIMSMEIGEKNKMMKLMIFILMLLILLLFFLSMNMIMFYFFFEIILIPTFFLVVYWGGNPERISAAFYLLTYMMIFSLPLLYFIMKIFFNMGSLDFNILMKYMESMDFLGIGSFMMILSVFMVKLPVYIFHIWLPKAHVEAPVYGSMVLAGVLLKLGGYGLLRLMMVMIKQCVEYNFMILSFGVVGGLFSSLVCMVQIDMKSMVAYSSVVHMNMMLSSVSSLYKLGFLSAYIMMISHGLCSSGLFYMVNLYYKWSSSRLLMLNKGVMNLYPSLSMWWFLLCVTNFSFPFSLNFFSEIFMIMVIMKWEVVLMTYMMLICFFSSYYSLYLYSFIQHGEGIGLKTNNYISKIKEFMILWMHFFPLLLMLLNLVMMM